MLPVITLERNAPEHAIREAIVSSYRAHFAHSFRTNNSIFAQKGPFSYRQVFVHYLWVLNLKLLRLVHCAQIIWVQ